MTRQCELQRRLRRKYHRPSELMARIAVLDQRCSHPAFVASEADRGELAALRERVLRRSERGLA